MISKTEIVDELAIQLRRSAEWRERLSSRFPDARNAIAARKLRDLAGEAHEREVSDEVFEDLAVRYATGYHGEWREGVASACRDVVFRTPVPSFAAFAEHVSRAFSDGVR